MHQALIRGLQDSAGDPDQLTTDEGELSVPRHTIAGLDPDQSSRFLPRNTRGDRTGNRDFIPIQEVPLPATLPVGQSQPASESKKVFVDKDLSLAPSGREPIQPWTPALVDKGSLPALPFASEEMPFKLQVPSIGDNMRASQVLPVHLPTAEVSMEPRHGPWVPAYVSGTCQNEECPPAAREVSSLATEAEKLGGGDAVSLEAPQTREESHSVQARAAEETQGHTCSPALSPKRLPPENQLTNQVKCFLQRLSPGRKHKEMERSLAKGSSPLMSVKGTGLLKGRIEFHGSTEAQKGVRDPRVVLGKQLGHRHGTVIPVSPLMGSEAAQQEAQLQAEAEPVLRLPHSCCQASCSPVPRAESCSPGQGQAAPERCGMAGEAKMMDTSPMHAPQGARGPPKSYL